MIFFIFRHNAAMQAVLITGMPHKDMPVFNKVMSGLSSEIANPKTGLLLFKRKTY
jgi:hypothetical protein